MFKKPEVRNAQMTTYWMSAILAVMFAGIALLIVHYHVMPVKDVTMLSQVAEMTLGRGFAYYYVQVTTMMVLYLAGVIYSSCPWRGLPV